MISVCVAGATGWTGRAVAHAVREADDLRLGAAVSRSAAGLDLGTAWGGAPIGVAVHGAVAEALDGVDVLVDYTSHEAVRGKDRKSTRLNSSHEWISYAVFCLKK